MRYVVRTVGWDKQRLANVDVLATQIGRLEVQIDHVGDWYGSFFAVCNRIDETGAVLLEDDVQLCDDFCERLETIVGQKGTDKVYSFFEKPKVWLPTQYVGGSNFLWMQCIYLPPGLPARMEPHFERFKLEKPQRFKGLSVDSFISYVLVQERVKYWRIRPCLVQHLDFKSLGQHAAGRQTSFFIDDLLRAGINYEDMPDGGNYGLR